MEQKKRDVSIDIAKGILGILVIFGHMFGGMTGVQTVMHPLLLPSFFMISGLMMRMTGEAKRPFPGILLKRTIGILVPYFFFEVFGILTDYLVYGYRIPVGEMIRNSLTMRCNISPDWFLFVLYFAQLFSIVALKLCALSKRKLLWECLFAFVSMAAVIGLTGIGTEGNWRGEILVRMGLANGFIMTGYLLSDAFLRKRSAAGVAAAALYLAVTILLGRVQLGNYLYDNPFMGVEYGPLGAYFLLAVSGCFGVLQVSKRIPVRIPGSALAYLGCGSLILMGTHLPLAQLIGLCTGFKAVSVPERLLMWTILCALEYPVIWLIRRYLPFLIGKGFFEKLYKR